MSHWLSDLLALQEVLIRDWLNMCQFYILGHPQKTPFLLHNRVLWANGEIVFF